MGNRSGSRGGEGSGTVRGSRPAVRSRRIDGARSQRALALPAFLARRVRLRPLSSHALLRPAQDGGAPPPPLTIDELLTGWVSSARGVHEPDTLDDCADYARYLDDVNRARHDAETLCERLRERLAAWIDGERQNVRRPLNRLTPSG